MVLKSLAVELACLQPPQVADCVLQAAPCVILLHSLSAASAPAKLEHAVAAFDHRRFLDQTCGLIPAYYHEDFN
jgi:hypothetical protein